jgi:hypothetical protein
MIARIALTFIKSALSLRLVLSHPNMEQQSDEGPDQGGLIRRPLVRPGRITFALFTHLLFALSASVTQAQALSPSLAEALDCNLVWTTGGDAPWTGQTNYTWDGQDAAQSSVISPLQESWIETTVVTTNGSLLQFHVQVDAGEDYSNNLIVLRNGAEKARLAGRWWQSRLLFLPPGTNTVRWVYARTSQEDLAEYSYQAWVDQVTVQEFLNPTADGDGDGISDFWEYTFFENLDQGFSTDFDNDSSSDLDEFRDGTDPTDALSLRYVVTASAIHGGLTIPITNRITRNTEITLDATADESFSFLGWGGDVSGTMTPTNIVVRGRTKVVAVCGRNPAGSLDAEELPWPVAEPWGWFGQTNVTHDGVDAAQVWPMTAKHTSLLGTTIILSKQAVVSFWWKMQSVSAYENVVRFRLNGESLPLTLFGNTDWEKRLVRLPPGTNQVEWMFDGVSGDDESTFPTNRSAFIDDVAVREYENEFEDTDADNLPDLWEAGCFHTLDQSAHGDPDGDGVSNIDEYYDDTNPVSSESAFPRLTVITVGPGTVTSSPQLLKYELDAVVHLTATPNSGERFLGWSGDLEGEQSAKTIYMNRSKTVRAYFRRPPNDHFAHRQVLAGPTNLLYGYTVGATAEPGEPNHGYRQPPHKSVWYTWKAPSDGQLIFATDQGHGRTAVYTGSVISNLHLVTRLGPNSASGSFKAQANHTYQIAMDTTAGATFTLLLSLHPPPDNDFFTNATLLTGYPLTVTGTTVAATTETGEPWGGEHSVWYKWTAPANGKFGMVVSADAFDSPGIAVYTGDTLNVLHSIGVNENLDDRWLTSFEAEAGVTYRIRIAGGDAANFSLHLTKAPSAQISFPAERANFSSPATFTILFNGFDDETPAPTLELFQKNLPLIEVHGNAGSHAVQLGSGIHTFTLVATDNLGLGNSTVTTVLVDGAPNDDFTNRFVLEGTTPSATGSVAIASSEIDEPPSNEQRSVWWTWLAPSNGVGCVTLRATNWYPNTIAYVGETLPSLQKVGISRQASYEPVTGGLLHTTRCYFNAVAGTPYQIAFSSGHEYVTNQFVFDVTVLDPAPNDNFNDAILLEEPTNSVAGFNGGATREIYEMPPAPGAGGKSVWYSWTAPGRGTVEISIHHHEFIESGFLSVFTGSSLDHLRRIASATPEYYPPGQFRVRLEVTANTTYYLAVDSSRDTVARFVLDLAYDPISNDNFVDALPLTGNTNTIHASTLGATREIGEARHVANGTGSLWWKWTAPASGLTRFLYGNFGGVQPHLARFVVYTGTVLTNLTTIASSDTIYSRGAFIPVQILSNQVYYIVLETTSAVEDNFFEITIQQPIAPVIDARTETATVATGSTMAFSPTVYGYTPLRFQWKVDGKSIAGATNREFQIRSVSPNHSGTYSLLAENDVASIERNIAVYDIVGSIPIPAALDNTSLRWISTGARPWTGQSSVTHDGNDALVCGNNGSSQLTTTITGPGVLSFWCKAKADGDSPGCYFVVASNYKRMENTFNWRKETFSVPAGVHLVEWRTDVDPGSSKRFWLDEVSFIAQPYLKPTITRQPLSRQVVVGERASFSVGVTGVQPFSFQWLRNWQTIPGATASSLVFQTAHVRDASEYSVQVRNSFGSATSASAFLSVCDFTLNPTMTTVGPEGAENWFYASRTSGNCGWNISTTNHWIVILKSYDEVVSYWVAPNNTEEPRIGTINVGNKHFHIAQRARTAPANIAGYTLALVATNDSSEAPPDTSYLVVFARATNTFLTIAQAKTAPAHSGLFIYDSTNDLTATASLSTGGTNLALHLTFTNAVAGRYRLRVENVETESGAFVLSPSRPDFNHDGLADLAWSKTNGNLTYWSMDGSNYLGSFMLGHPSLGSGWHAIGAADFNHDDVPDVLYANTNRVLAIGFNDSTAILSNVLVNTGIRPENAWAPMLVADLNQDEQPDIIFQDSTGRAAVWLLAGANVLKKVSLRNGTRIGMGWHLVAAADFNEDSYPDLLWQSATGKLQIWCFMGTEFAGALYPGTIRSDWNVLGSFDANNDGYADLLLRRTGGRLFHWTLKGSSVTGSGAIRPGFEQGSGWTLFSPQ